MTNFRQYITIIIGSLLLLACQDDWLEVKRDKQQVVPGTAEELQALLDNTEIMNEDYPFLGEVSTNDMYLEYEWWQRAATASRNAYRWVADIYEGEDAIDWELSYERILYANIVLDAVDQLANNETTDQIKGQALFFRAWNYYQLAQLFCKPYDAGTAATDLGIPLRHEADISVPVVRATVEETYGQILADAMKAVERLPAEWTVNTRPTKAAAHGLLAKTFLHMRNYQQALEHAREALALEGTLVDFNDLDPETDYPLEQNGEIIFYAQLASVLPVSDDPFYINPDLFYAFENDDLRKSMYFRGIDGYGFKGSFSDNGFYLFSGLAVGELYLIAAECLARDGQGDEGLAYLNDLLLKRYASGTFTPLDIPDASAILERILLERRKELVFRGIRWSDLRRLNREEAFEHTLTRTLNGETYELPPNDPRYVMPIPNNVIAISGIQQNVRQ